MHLDWSEPDDEVKLFFSADGVTVLAPLPGGRYRIVATVDEAPERPSLDFVQDLMRTRGPKAHPATVKEIAWSSRFRVHANLAGKLAAVLADGAPDSVLDEYETERRPVAEEVVAFTHRMTRMATMSGGPLRGLRNTALRALDFVPAVHRTLAMSLSELATEPHPGS
jgi:hypothetical protein